MNIVHFIKEIIEFKSNEFNLSLSYRNAFAEFSRYRRMSYILVFFFHIVLCLLFWKFMIVIPIIVFSWYKSTLYVRKIFNNLRNIITLPVELLNLIIDNSIDPEYVLKYSEGKSAIHLTFFKLSRPEDKKLYNLSSPLSALFDAEVIMTENYTSIIYTLLFPIERATWKDTLKNTRLLISEEAQWEFGSPPHVLLAGSTKSGKTFMIENLVAQYLCLGSEIKLLDPKKGELSWLVGKKLEDRLGCKVVYNSPFQIAGALREAVEEMNRRFQVMADNPDIYISKGKVLSWADIEGNYPLVVVLDEGIAFKTESESTKEGQKHTKKQ